MKKWFALFLVLCMLPLMGMAMAEETTERFVIYTQVPEDWQFPCLWAWSDDGQNAFAAWPGDDMIADASNPGWYYAYVPAFVDAVILSANGATVQTSDYRVEKKAAWLTITDKDTVDVSFEAKTQGEAPAFVERYTVYAQVDSTWENPGIWAWENETGKNAFAAWPGLTMKANENGWYSAKVPENCDAIIVNANGGKVQTADIKELDPADMWLTLAPDGTFELTYDDPLKPVAEDITVSVKVPEDWAEPCLWAWSHPDGTNVFTAWPGEKLVQGEDGVYTLTIPGWANSIIINGNGGTVQTKDMAIETGKDIFGAVAGPEDYTLSYDGFQ